MVNMGSSPFFLTLFNGEGCKQQQMVYQMFGSNAPGMHDVLTKNVVQDMTTRVGGTRGTSHLESLRHAHHHLEQLFPSHIRSTCSKQSDPATDHNTFTFTMSGYSNQSQFTADYIGVTSKTRENDYNTNVGNPGPTSALNNHGIAIGGVPGTALPPHAMRGVVPQMTTTAMHQQHQPPLYDMSSFDPLQAQALQLSASAGLTTADILAAAVAPATAPGSVVTSAEGNSSVSNTPAAGIGAGIPQPAPQSLSQTQAQAQAPAHGVSPSFVAAPVSIPGGQLQPIQPIPATTQATTSQHPYIFIQPQQIAPNAIASPATTSFNGNPTAAAPNTLLVPATAAGVPGTAAHSAAAAQATAVAAAAAGLGTHPLLLNPAFLTVAAAQGVPGLTTSGRPGQVIQQHHTQPPVATQKQAQRHHAHVATPASLGPTLILPAAINPHQALSQSHSLAKKRPLGGGAMMNEIAPSVVSSATAPATETSNKRQRGQSKKVNNAEEALKAEDPAEKRRYERNLREQQRSSKISSQIKELREVLSDCNVPFKPNKYSILLKVVEYIKQLQSRAIMLDAEHQKLIATVRQTNEMITNAANNNGMSSTTGGATDNESSDTTQDAWQQGDTMNTRAARGGRGDSELCFVKGIDYRSIFEQCPTAFGIAALDGRILECNVEFQNLLGYSAREDLLKQSLFNLVHNHQDIFRAMAQMLKTAEEPAPKSASANTTSGANGVNDNPMDRFWTGPVTSKQNIKVSPILTCDNDCYYFHLASFKIPHTALHFVRTYQLSMNITLTSGDNGTPKFFSCALTNSV